MPLCGVVIGHAATAEIQGIEVEAQFCPMAGFDLNASYSYLDAEHESFASGATADNTGNTLQLFTPNELWGQMTAVYFFIANLVGLGLGPTAVALITDVVFADQQATVDAAPA